MEGIMEASTELIDAKLDLIRQEVRAGFEHLGTKFDGHEHRVEVLEERMRTVELDSAESRTKLKLLGILMSLGSGGLGAAFAKFWL